MKEVLYSEDIKTNNDLQILRVQLKKFGGRHYVDLRNYFKESGTTMDWLPSKKGITFSTSLLEEAVEKLNEIKSRGKEIIDPIL